MAGVEVQLGARVKGKTREDLNSSKELCTGLRAIFTREETKVPVLSLHVCGSSKMTRSSDSPESATPLPLSEAVSFVFRLHVLSLYASYIHDADNAYETQ